MNDAPSWSELSNLLDQLAYIAGTHAEIARAAQGLTGSPVGEDQLRRSLELLSTGQDALAVALRQAAGLVGAMAAGAEQPH